MEPSFNCELIERRIRFCSLNWDHLAAACELTSVARRLFAAASCPSNSTLVYDSLETGSSNRPPTMAGAMIEGDLTMPPLRGSLSARVTGVESAVPSNGNTPSASVTILPAELPLAHERRVRRVLEKIESQLPHSIRELALEVHLSAAHLRRLFQQETGRHLSHVLLERKLRHAAHLLATTDMPVKEIAYAVGYGHHSSFVRAFERSFGEAPRHYRLQRTA